MSLSISGFGHDYEIPVWPTTAAKLAGTAPLPRMGYEIEVAVGAWEHWPCFKEQLRLGNFSGRFALFSLVPRCHWLKLFNVDPEKI